MKCLKLLLFSKILLTVSCILVPLSVYASDSQGGSCVEGSSVDCKGVCNGSNGFDSQGNCCLANEQGCDRVFFSGKALDICGICGGDGTSCLDCNEVPFGTATFDICNVCDGDGTSCLDCSGTPFGGRTIDDCGICGGDGSTCNSCQRTGIRIDRYQPTDGFTFTTDAPGCLNTLFNNIYSQCPHKQHPGSCVAIRLVNQICGVDSYVANGSSCYRNYISSPAPIYFTLSPNCNDLQNSNAQEVNECLGSVVKIVSPISVLLDGSTRLSDDQLVITRFPLEPGKTDQWYSWKASDAAPLLVYDPSQSGKVTSAHQLFGNWTFGGKRVAHRGGISDVMPLLPAAWDNGFEALATLDSNGDGELSGKELDSLALWADSNRNGISEPGEVTPVTSSDISALYFDNIIEDGTGDLYVEKGFKRTTDGSTGTLVDWYSSHAASKQSVLLKEMGKAAGSIDGALFKSSSRELQLEGLIDADTSGELSLDSNGFDSIWEWKEKDGDMTGILVLSNADNSKTVTGFSIVQLNRQLKKGNENLAVAVPFTAEKSINSDRQGVLSFTVPSGEHMVTKTEAVLSEKCESLEGKSTIFRGTGQHQQQWHSYQWSAKKLY